MVRVEKVLYQQEIALGVFLDIEGAFNNTSYDSMCAALVRHRVHYTNVRWVKATMEGWQAIATLDSLPRSGAVSRGCPQGGVLSPLLWCLVDRLLGRLSGGGVYAQGHADDMSPSGGKIPKYGISVHLMGPFHRGAARSVCQLILTKLGSLLSREEGNF